MAGDSGDTLVVLSLSCSCWPLASGGWEHSAWHAPPAKDVRMAAAQFSVTTPTRPHGRASAAPIPSPTAAGRYACPPCRRRALNMRTSGKCCGRLLPTPPRRN